MRPCITSRWKLITGPLFQTLFCLFPFALYPSGVTLRSSLSIFGLGSAFAFAAFFLIVSTVPPETAGLIGEAFFLGSLFLGITGLLTILGILGRVRSSTLLPALHIGPAFRQAVLLACAAVGLLLLQRFRLLQWWNALLLVIVLVGLDLFFSRRDAGRAS